MSLVKTNMYEYDKIDIYVQRSIKTGNKEKKVSLYYKDSNSDVKVRRHSERGSIQKVSTRKSNKTLLKI